MTDERLAKLEAEANDNKNEYTKFGLWQQDMLDLIAEVKRLRTENMELRLAIIVEVKELREALNKIACWHEGPEGTNAFDSPWSARIAREALGKNP